MPKKIQRNIKIDKQYSDFSSVKLPKRPAVEAMIENLHKAGEKSAAKIL